MEVDGNDAEASDVEDGEIADSDCETITLSSDSATGEQARGSPTTASSEDVVQDTRRPLPDAGRRDLEQKTTTIHGPQVEIYSNDGNARKESPLASGTKLEQSPGIAADYSDWDELLKKHLLDQKDVVNSPKIEKESRLRESPAERTTPPHRFGSPRRRRSARGSSARTGRRKESRCAVELLRRHNSDVRFSARSKTGRAEPCSGVRGGCLELVDYHGVQRVGPPEKRLKKAEAKLPSAVPEMARPKRDDPRQAVILQSGDLRCEVVTEKDISSHSAKSKPESLNMDELREQFRDYFGAPTVDLARPQEDEAAEVNMLRHKLLESLHKAAEADKLSGGLEDAVEDLEMDSVPCPTSSRCSNNHVSPGRDASESPRATESSRPQSPPSDYEISLFAMSTLLERGPPKPRKREHRKARRSQVCQSERTRS